MTRNVKRFLAASLLSLTPSIAFAGQVESGFLDFLSQRDEYVTVREGAVQVPALRNGPVASIAPALENFSLGLQVVTGTFNGVFNPYPVPTANYGGFQVDAPAPTPLVAQEYYWTVDPANPAGAKTCVWRVEVSDVGGSCSAQVFYGTYGGAVCTLDEANSFINPTTCETQIITIIQ
ncbi:hypothetical protein JQX13_08215 [Archangium violaceum]|uniref:hypothetical protein n=1 Tax=Archangium violaceum TaxID=83451 RepID=UPI00193C7B9E|nr:hypothetical protein [Archangium violaceum]QRK10068.1 hypothetical protein JQX13_08215 [Archangium violaceum]